MTIIMTIIMTTMTMTTTTTAILTIIFGHTHTHLMRNEHWAEVAVAVLLEVGFGDVGGCGGMWGMCNVTLNADLCCVHVHVMKVCPCDERVLVVGRTRHISVRDEFGLPVLLLLRPLAVLVVVEVCVLQLLQTLLQQCLVEVGQVGLGLEDLQMLQKVGGGGGGAVCYGG
jgi:hypothetical protein